MLKIRKNVTLFADIKIGETLVVSLSATVDNNTGVKNSYTESIRDSELYRANSTQVRQEIREFEDALYALEDEMSVEVEAAIAAEATAQ